MDKNKALQILGSYGIEGDGAISSVLLAAATVVAGDTTQDIFLSRRKVNRARR